MRRAILPLFAGALFLFGSTQPGIRMSVETRPHLRESVARIDAALKANMQRAGF